MPLQNYQMQIAWYYNTSWFMHSDTWYPSLRLNPNAVINHFGKTLKHQFYSNIVPSNPQPQYTKEKPKARNLRAFSYVVTITSYTVLIKSTISVIAIAAANSLDFVQHLLFQIINKMKHGHSLWWWKWDRGNVSHLKIQHRCRCTVWW